MSRAFTPVLVGVAPSVSEILLPFKEKIRMSSLNCKGESVVDLYAGK